MSDEDIDLERVIVDPEYRRKVIAFLNAAGTERQYGNAAEDKPGPAGPTFITAD